ncbi:hypothetical protein B9C88_09785 [Brevibacillus laterosporus]|uniref:hypothetical protein n=1 Tax=Brevibacillus laterosporus TaxID=1465 RepID=UPI000BDD2644|nr:hypothetical protein [Brevibacillus laterosporus]PCN44495.1 hypothetical protein B9C88_09785 [Brevibacillus laterosporus]
MRKFSQMGLEDKAAEVFDYCENCEVEIYENQSAWMAGNELFCSKGCLEKGLKIKHVKVKDKRK